MTKNGSSVLVMTIVGRAVCLVIMGRTADVSRMAVGFKVPMAALPLYHGMLFSVRRVYQTTLKINLRTYLTK